MFMKISLLAVVLLCTSGVMGEGLMENPTVSKALNFVKSETARLFFDDPALNDLAALAIGGFLLVTFLPMLLGLPLLLVTQLFNLNQNGNNLLTNAASSISSAIPLINVPVTTAAPSGRRRRGAGYMLASNIQGNLMRLEENRNNFR